MEWTEVLSAAGAVAVPFGLSLWALVEWRGRRVWASKKLEEKHTKTRELADSTEDRVALLEQAHVHQAEMIQKTVVESLTRIEVQVGKITDSVEAHGQQIVALEGGQGSLGRSVDELRDRMNREIQKP